MNRRGFLSGLICAPAIVAIDNIMPVRQMLWMPAWSPVYEGQYLLTPAMITRASIRMFVDTNHFLEQIDRQYE